MLYRLENKFTISELVFSLVNWRENQITLFPVVVCFPVLVEISWGRVIVVRVQLPKWLI